MDFLKKYWPRAFKATDIAAMIIAIIIYLVIGAVAGFVLGICAKIPVINWVTGIVGTLVEIYVFVGVVLSVLKFLKIVK